MAAFTSAPAVAQFTTKVRFTNFSPHHRVEWGRATVPFPSGVWLPGKQFKVRGLPSQLLPFGARWDDGSVRFAQLLVALDLAPGQERVVEVVEGGAALPPFAPSPWLQQGLAEFDMKLVCRFPELGVRVAPLRLERVVEDGPARRILLFRSRVPDSALVYDLWVSLFSGQDHAPFELRLTNSSTESPHWVQPIDAVDLWVQGALPMVRGMSRRGVTPILLSGTGPSIVRLLGSTHIYDGQSQEWWGDLLFARPTGAPAELTRLTTLLAVLDSPLYGCSTDWAASGAFGPFGFVPPAPPWVTDGGRAAARSQRLAYNAWVRGRGSPWDDMPMGLFKFPGSTGAQPDFGAAKLVQTFASGLPDGIEEARMNASEEAMRPVHHREADGTPLRAVNHPSWVAGGGRTHWHLSVSPDRLGKPYPEPPRQAHGWDGKDDQHWSSLTLASAYLLTRSPSLRYELDNEAELYMASATLPSRKPGWSTNAMGAPRGVGRTLLSMSWNYLCTGRSDLRNHVQARIREVVFPQMVGKQVAGPVKPLMLMPPEPRQLPLVRWVPWEEAQAILGLEAAHRVTKSAEAHQVARVTARTLMLYGWKAGPGQLTIATALAWLENGTPLTLAQQANPHLAMWSNGLFNTWSVPAVKLAAVFGQRYGDPGLAQIAGYVYAAIEAGRRKPSPYGGWDEFSDWDAVR